MQHWVSQLNYPIKGEEKKKIKKKKLFYHRVVACLVLLLLKNHQGSCRSRYRPNLRP